MAKMFSRWFTVTTTTPRRHSREPRSRTWLEEPNANAPP